MGKHNKSGLLLAALLLFAVGPGCGDDDDDNECLPPGGGTETVVLTPTSEGHFEGVYSATGEPESVSIESGDLQDDYDNTNGEAIGPVAFP